MAENTPPPRAKAVPARGSYRHGDLRRALLEAGLALAADGGPDAVVLREVTRRAGVAPNAAYRHFASRQDLLEAVRQAAVAAMAEGMEAQMATQMAALPQVGDAAQQARARLRAVGAGYLRFARTQTGLFRMAFGGSFSLASSGAGATAGRSGMDPFQHLGHALDLMVAAGLLPPARRPGAEFLAWSTVHGLALLAIDGPLRALPPEQFDGLEQRLLDMVERGL